MTTPQQTLERAYAALNAAAFAHPSAADDIGTQCSEAAKELRALLAQPAAAPPAPGGDVLERRSETGMPMSANAPEKCPITRRPFFMVISHPELGWVPTYGGPYDSYTIPHMEGKPDEPYHERELTCHHYDHDYGGWVDDESIPMRVINEGVLNALQSTQAPCPYEPHPSGICTKCGKAHAPTATQGQDAAPADQTQAVELLDERGEIRRDLKGSAYCVGNEYKPFHPSASHVRPEWRDGWNACFVAAIRAARAKE